MFTNDMLLYLKDPKDPTLERSIQGWYFWYIIKIFVNATMYLHSAK
jgi:hypothetical protein